MHRQELDRFFAEQPHIEWLDDVDQEQLLFRNTELAWYQADANRATAIKYWKIDMLTPDALLGEINRGLELEQITRITGYFTKINSWNPGKRGELHDRRRWALSS